MTALHMMTSGDCFGAILQMVEQKSDLESVLQQLRLYRLKLGSILDQLETFEPGPEALDQLRFHSDGIGTEVDSLNDIVRQLLGK
jgi:hypothetical protein